MAMDSAWWNEYQPIFNGEKVTVVDTKHATKVKLRGSPRNSGAAALLLAAHRDAERVILLGYDCKYAQNGKRHWHNDHGGTLGNAGSVNKWVQQFIDISKYLDSIDVVNCTRDTDLKIFRRATLEEELC